MVHYYNTVAIIIDIQLVPEFLSAEDSGEEFKATTLQPEDFQGDYESACQNIMLLKSK